MGIFRDTPSTSEPPLVVDAVTKLTTAAKIRPHSFLAFHVKKSSSDQELNTSISKEQLNKSDRFFTGLLGKLVGKNQDNEKTKTSERRKPPSMFIDPAIYKNQSNSSLMNTYSMDFDYLN